MRLMPLAGDYSLERSPNIDDCQQSEILDNLYNDRKFRVWNYYGRFNWVWDIKNVLIFGHIC